MQSQVTLGWTQDFRLQHAILVYGAHGQQFATIHEPMPAPDGGAPYLGPGAPVTHAFVRALAEGLGQHLRPEVLPPHVLCRTPEVIAWWVPARHRPMFFETRNAALDELSARQFPHPALVFKLSGTHLWLRALDRSERPGAQAPLFVAPYYNTSQEGSVCVGTMRVPEHVGLDTLDAWEAGYFGSAFTHAYGAARLTTHAGGFAGLWTTLAASPDAFPSAALVSARETLGEFIAR